MVLGAWFLDESKSGAVSDCYKGQPKRVSKAVHCIVDTPVEEHSRKPNIVRKKIVELAGDLPRAELFARQEYPGWVCVGNEIDGMDIRDSLQMLKER